jgi:biopolymer transport protein ExbD
MKFKRNIKKPDVVIDLTSMIDIVFILLLFYMLGTTFTRPNSLKITLPQANGQTTDQRDLRVEVVVTKTGSYIVNGHELGDSKVESLMQAITDIAAGDNNVPVTLTADANTTHQSVVTAMDAVARLGFSKLNIATRQSEAAGK